MDNNIGIYIWFSIITILAIIVGPILAVQVETYLGRKREERERRLQVFRTLMITRKIPLSGFRIDALNSIDIYFDRDEEVSKKWREYLDSLNNPNKEKISEDEANSLKDKADEKFIDMLEVMAKAVGYKKFDKIYIKNTTYLPEVYLGYLENQIKANKDISPLIEIIKSALNNKSIEQKIPMDKKRNKEDDK